MANYSHNPEVMRRIQVGLGIARDLAPLEVATRKEVGRILKISTNRVAIIEAKALFKLRTRMQAHIDQEQKTAADRRK